MKPTTPPAPGAPFAPAGTDRPASTVAQTR
jgi:hypothetical protein